MRIKMRLKKTKGMHGFQSHMIERYANRSTDSTDGVFSSACRQGLTLFRLKQRAHIEPEAIPRHKVNRTHELKKLRSKWKHRGHIRGRTVTNLFSLYGVFRPWAEQIFGTTVKKVSLQILQDPWMLIVAPEQLAKETGETLDAHLTESQSVDFEYEDIGECLDVLERWGRKGSVGEFETFSGTFDVFFPLHEKQALYDIGGRWASFKMIRWTWVEAKDAEFKSLHSVHHPHNTPVRHFTPLYQPIDEIRDYFGDVPALYFAWMDLYTRALIWPAGLGVLGMLLQLSVESVDDNPFTIPYSIFFAAWSMLFLSSWIRRANELKFLWGTDGFELREPPRPQFKGLHVVNPETHRDDVIYDPVKQVQRATRLGIGYIISFCYISFTIYCSIEATLIKDNNRLTPDEWEQAGLVRRYKYMMISATLNLTIIFVYGNIYEAIAVRLAEWENHRTASEFEDAVISKTFLFQFINNYFVLFYIAMLRPFVSNCVKEIEVPDADYGPDGSGSGTVIAVTAMDATMCKTSDLPELQFQLLVVFTGKTIGWRMGAILKPKMKYWVKEMMTIMKLDLDTLKTLEESDNRTAQIVHHIDDLNKLESNMAEMNEEQVQNMRQEHASTMRLGDTSIQKSDDTSTTSGISLSNWDEPGTIPSAVKQVGNGDDTVKASHGSGDANGDDLDYDDGDYNGDKQTSAKVSATTNQKPSVSMMKRKKAEMLLARQKLAHRKAIQAQLRQSYADNGKVEDEYAMEPAEDTFDEFNEMAVQFGYLALFAPAYPLAPLLAFINNLFQIRLSAMKFCTTYRRPRFRPAENIGAWYSVLNILAFLAVITNSTMLTFVGSQLGHEDEQGGPEAGKAGISIRIYSQRLWVLTVGIEHAVMLMRIGIMQMSPEMPTWLADAKDTLDFRIMRMEEQVETLLAQGKTMNEIHSAMNEKHSHQILTRKVGSKIRSLKRFLPILHNGPDVIEMHKYGTHKEQSTEADLSREDEHGDDVEHQTKDKSSSVKFMENATNVPYVAHSNELRSEIVDFEESVADL